MRERPKNSDNLVTRGGREQRDEKSRTTNASRCRREQRNAPRGHPLTACRNRRRQGGCSGRYRSRAVAAPPEPADPRHRLAEKRPGLFRPRKRETGRSFHATDRPGWMTPAGYYGDFKRARSRISVDGRFAAELGAHVAADYLQRISSITGRTAAAAAGGDGGKELRRCWVRGVYEGSVGGARFVSAG
jgi:hypothetical protein